MNWFKKIKRWYGNIKNKVNNFIRRINPDFKKRKLIREFESEHNVSHSKVLELMYYDENKERERKTDPNDPQTRRLLEQIHNHFKGR